MRATARHARHRQSSEDLHDPVIRGQRSPDHDAGAARPVIVVGRGPGRTRRGDRPRSARHVPVRRARRRRHRQRRLARDLLREAHARDPRSARLRRARSSTRASAGTSARCSSATSCVYQFDLLPEPGHRRPAFVNLQQYHLEECLVDRARAARNVELRWQNKVVGVAPRDDDVAADGRDAGRRLRARRCDWLIAGDGARSPVRELLGLDAKARCSATAS